MKNAKIYNYLSVFGALLISACSSNDGPDGPPAQENEKYVLITMSENVLTKPGYITVFDELPAGDVSNTTERSFQGMGMGGWRPQQNMLLKMFSSQANELGIERLVVNATNQITVDKFIKAIDQGTNGGGNFVIGEDRNGFYWDGNEPLKIQTFDANSLSRTGEIDLTAAVNERGSDEASIQFRSVGQKFLAIKEGKLYANITYATTNGTQKGFWDDFFPDVYIAVIDIATGTYEKTITIENTGSIAYINDNHMYDVDANGDLYIVCQGRSALGGQSKIVRIKANETTVDPNWSLEMDDIMQGGKFVSVFVQNGQLITTIPTTALTGGPNGNINFSEIWEFFSVDVHTLERTKITGVPPITNPGAAYGAVELDGKILLRVNAPSQNINGYYALEGTEAIPLFNVTAGGSVSGIYKITL